MTFLKDIKSDHLFEKAENLWKAGQPAEALEILSELEESGILHPKIHVLRYFCLFTQENDLGLDEMEAQLRKAIDIDEDYLPALVELGYFKLNVLDQPIEAVDLFKRANSVGKRLLNEGILGEARCLAEIASPEAARQLLAYYKATFLSESELEQLDRDLGSIFDE